MRRTCLILLTVICLSNQAFSQKKSPQIFANGKPTKLLQTGANEGPAWHPKLGLLSSGNGGVHMLMPNKFKLMFLPEAGTNGLLFEANGMLLMCQPKYRRVSRLHPKTKQIEVLTDSFEGNRYNQPNDITVDSQGRIYFTDPKYGNRKGMEQLDADGRAIEGVYRIDPDGKVSRIITHEVDRPNGIVVTPDDEFLYVADNNNNTVGVVRALFRFDLRPDGTVDLGSKKKLFDWKTGRGPDGMVLDEQGRIYVAGGLNEPHPPHETNDLKGGVYVISPKGELLDFVPIPQDEVTNCTFGGLDRKTLYITAGGTLWSIRTLVPGVTPMLSKK